MASTHPLVRAAALTNYAEVARAAGLNPIRMLGDAGIGANVLQDPDLRIPAERVARLLEASAAASGVESFGLQMAETRRLSNFGPIGMLIRDQPTLRDSLVLMLRYHALLNGALSLVIEEAAGTVVIREDVIVGAGVSPRQAIELAIGVMLRLIRSIVDPQWRPTRVCFVHPAPRDLRTHLRVFGPCVEFNHDFNGIVCASTDLDTPNPTADPAMARYAKQLLEEATAQPQPTLAEEVRRAILLLLPSGRATIEQVAAHLGVVPRTVQRRLADEGVSFSALVNEVRVELAQRHVLGSTRALTEVAALLGFSAQSGFSRWYSDQFGCSPMKSRSAAPAQRPGA
jgi:AraC-like DNA-binding protein